MSSLTGGIRFRTAAMLSLPHSPQAAVARRTRRAAPASSARPPAAVTSTTFSRSRPAVFAAVDERGDVVHRRDDALREQQPGGEIQIVSGRPHRDDQALAADPDLQRLFGDHEIAIGGAHAAGARITATLDRAFDDPDAGLRPDRE